MPKVSWRRWKMGLVVAGFTGFCKAFLAGAVVKSMTGREFVILVAGFVAADLVQFLNRNPVQDIDLGDNTQVVSRGDSARSSDGKGLL